MYFDKIVDDYNHKGRKFYPAAKEHIEQLIKIWNHLPASYIEFLKTMGGGSGYGFLAGESVFTDELFNLKEWGLELLEENNSSCKLSDDDFVFWMSQGCMFGYFNIYEGDDPPVYFYTENEPDTIRKISNHFSEFIYNMYFYPSVALKAIE